MSFVITLNVREGIVMAADSRLTLNSTQDPVDGKQILQVSVGQSDSNHKLFRAQERIGISTFGAADIDGVPIGGFVETFLRGLDDGIAVDEVPEMLLTYFMNLPGPPDTGFHVCGYKTMEEQQVWLVNVSADTTTKVNEDQGVVWNGESDILARLIQPMAQLNPQGKVMQVMPYHQVPWGFFTLQDAIDFARYAVQVTIDTIHFLPRAKTVGGPVDILVIRSEGAEWVQQKTLHA